MQEKAQILQGLFGKYGGVLDTQKITNSELKFSAKGILDIYRHWIKTSGEKSTADEEPQGLPYNNIHIELIDNLNVNAVATVHDDEDYVGVFWGTLHFFAFYFNAFFSDPDVFSNIGDTKKEFVDKRTMDFLRVPNAKFYTQFPNDIFRQEVTKKVNFMACSMIFYHEVAHIVRCHIDFLAQDHAVNEHIEYSALPGTDEMNEIKKALEFDADRSAVQNTLSTLDALLKPLTKENNFQIDPLSLWAVSLTIMFFIFETHTGEINQGNVAVSHPRSWSRLAMSIDCAEQHLEMYTTEENVHERINAGVTEVIRWWKRHELPTILKKTDYEFIYKEMEDISVTYNSLNDRLLELQLLRKKKLIANMEIRNAK